MEMSHVGSVLVLNDNGLVEGIFTERDLITKCPTDSALEKIKIPDVMSKPVHFIKAKASIARLLYHFSQNDYRHVPVLAADLSTPLIISIRDLIDFLYRVVTKKMSDEGGAKVYDEIIMDRFFAANLDILKPLRAISLSENASVGDALEVMRSERIGSIVATDKDQSVSGIFTERDFSMRVLGKMLVAKRTRLHEVMTSQPICLRLTSRVAEAFNLMSEHGYRHVPIVDDRRKLRAVVSVKNLIAALAASILDELEHDR